LNRSEAYHTALNAGSEGQLKLDIYRNNLARANLTLTRCDQARANASSALTGGANPANVTLYGTAYYRAGCASYHLEPFGRADTCGLEL